MGTPSLHTLAMYIAHKGLCGLDSRPSLSWKRPWRESQEEEMGLTKMLAYLATVILFTCLWVELMSFNKYMPLGSGFPVLSVACQERDVVPRML